MESLSSSDDEEVQRITNPSPPKVVLNYEDDNQEHPQESLPPVLRRAKFRQASVSPAGSPKVTSPEPSPVASPRSTPRGSPINSPRGVKKLIKRGKVSDKKMLIAQKVFHSALSNTLFLDIISNNVLGVFWQIHTVEL